MQPYHFVPAEHVLKPGMTLVRRSADKHTDAVVTVKSVEEGKAKLCDESCVPVRPDPSGVYKCTRLAYMSPTYRLPTPALLEMVERYQLSEECHHLFRQLKINTLGVSELRHVSSLLGQINRTLRGTRT